MVATLKSQKTLLSDQKTALSHPDFFLILRKKVSATGTNYLYLMFIFLINKEGFMCMLLH